MEQSKMATAYHPFKIALTDGQKKSLQKAFAAKAALTLRVKPKQLGHGDDLLLTATQINRMKKAASKRRGADLKMSKTQIEKTAQRGGNLFSTVLGLARPLLAPAAKALATAGLSFGAEKALKKIFGNGFGPQEVQLYQLAQRLSPQHRKAVEKFLVGQGVVRGGGAAQYCGFLGMLASIGIPLAIDLVKKVLGRGMQVRSRRSAPLRQQLPLPPSSRGKGMQMRPPPVYGRWEDRE